MDTTLNNSIANQLMDSMNLIKKEFHEMREKSIESQQSIVDRMTLKFIELKKENTEEIKTLLSISSNATNEKLFPQFQNITEQMLIKTTQIINELIPKNNDVFIKELNLMMKELNLTFKDETSKLNSQSIDKTTLITMIENKINQSITQTQTFITNSLTTTEHKLNDLREIVVKDGNKDEDLRNSVSNIVKKMENASCKGAYSENIVFSILQGLFPSAEINLVANLKEYSGDIMLIRENKPTVMIENKSYENRNIPSEQVKKFIRDVDEQKCCGLFLSQMSGIAHKQNFEINIQNKNVLLYLHNVNNDADKIKTAVDIIDSLKSKLDEFKSENNEEFIDANTLIEINKEFQSFAEKKLAITKGMRDDAEKRIREINQLNLSSLDAYLTGHFTNPKTKAKETTFVCSCCQSQWKNSQSLAAHFRGCQSNPERTNKKKNVKSMGIYSENGNDCDDMSSQFTNNER
jgi:hypothetical protein